ncbi:MAG: VOC family protein, partial [Thermoplasmata archaeon]|nr:VOC family protein [Thermoplasmata archaeon]
MKAAAPKFFGPMLNVRDFEASLSFYRDTLGMKGDGENPYAEFTGGKSVLVILDHAFGRTVGGLAGPTP